MREKYYVTKLLKDKLSGLNMGYFFYPIFNPLTEPSVRTPCTALVYKFLVYNLFLLSPKKNQNKGFPPIR